MQRENKGGKTKVCVNVMGNIMCLEKNAVKEKKSGSEKIKLVRPPVRLKVPLTIY